MGRSEKESEYLHALGSRIRSLRHEKGWSQEEFAFRCSLHRTYVGSVERGERNISAINLKRVADALNVPVNSLFDDTSES